MSTAISMASWIGNFLYHIAPQVVGVLIGGLIFQRYFVRRANESAFIDYLVKGLDELCCHAMEYWSMEGNAKSRDRARYLEARVKGAVKSLTSELRRYSERYAKKVDFGPLMMEVSDACTNGQFEAATKTADSARPAMVVNSIHRVKWELMKRKL